MRAGERPRFWPDQSALEEPLANGSDLFPRLIRTILITSDLSLAGGLPASGGTGICRGPPFGTRRDDPPKSAVSRVSRKPAVPPSGEAGRNVAPPGGTTSAGGAARTTTRSRALKECPKTGYAHVTTALTAPGEGSRWMEPSGSGPLQIGRKMMLKNLAHQGTVNILTSALPVLLHCGEETHPPSRRRTHRANEPQQDLPRMTGSPARRRPKAGCDPPFYSRSWGLKLPASKFATAFRTSGGG
jgi:hypothetical protein